MSVYPAAEIASCPQQFTAADVASDRQLTPAAPCAGSISGTNPKPEIASVQNETHSLEASRDEVQVQQDGGDGKIVIRYLDGSGNVILQIPSSQLLGLSRAIGEALDEQAKIRSSAHSSEPVEGSNLHGH
jgi:hypothetical protein